MYLTILYPKAVKPQGQKLSDNDIIFRDNGQKRRNSYKQNASFMKEAGERRQRGFTGGVTYAWEVKKEIEHHYKDGEKPENKSFKSTCDQGIQKPSRTNSNTIFININRTLSNTASTMSEVNIPEFGFSCYCLKRPGPDTTTRGLRKRIPIGIYKVKWRYSSKNKSLGKAFVLFNNDVSASRLILIHIGNYPKDSDGCLLFGSTQSNNFVGNSTNTIYKFYKLFKNVDVNRIKINITQEYQYEKVICPRHY